MKSAAVETSWKFDTCGNGNGFRVTIHGFGDDKKAVILESEDGAAVLDFMKLAGTK